MLYAFYKGPESLSESKAQLKLQSSPVCQCFNKKSICPLRCWDDKEIGATFSTFFFYVYSRLNFVFFSCNRSCNKECEYQGENQILNVQEQNPTTRNRKSFQGKTTSTTHPRGSEVICKSEQSASVAERLHKQQVIKEINTDVQLERSFDFLVRWRELLILAANMAVEQPADKSQALPHLC